jgi:hypothetical protein
MPGGPGPASATVADPRGPPSEQEFRGCAGGVLSSLAGLASFLALALGYYLSPSGLGWCNDAEFLPEFGFLYNIRASTSVFL